jgi:hypothetical protein
MGIDIYATWPEQTFEEQEAQSKAWLSDGGGSIGYLREAYHGEPYPSRHLVAEAFDSPDGVTIAIETLRKRLPETLKLAEERERTVYNETDEAAVKRVVKQYSDFVDFCEKVERSTGQPPDIIASW